ncbi:thaumatin [Lactarius sanguifluus]|nr:thaumatin [Lactarius sanguifluus]
MCSCWPIIGNQFALVVSLVDGYNLPMRIDNNVGCGALLCGVDLGLNCLPIKHLCPTQLQGPLDSTEFPAGCDGACDAGLLSDRNNPPNCCTGNYDTSPSCPSSGVAFYSYFSEFLIDSEANGTSHFLCSSAFQDYTVTFCP